MVGCIEASARAAVQRVHRQARSGPESEPPGARLAVSRRDQDAALFRKTKAQHRSHRGQESQAQARLQTHAK